MKYILSLLLLITTTFADFYNTNTTDKITTLPNPLIYNGTSIFNAQWSIYQSAGWYKVQQDNIPYGYNILSTNFIVSPKPIIIITNGVAITNYYTNIEYIVKESYTLEPIVVNKPEFIQLAETQYISLWRILYGVADQGYTNAEYSTVAIEIMQMAQTNPSVLEYTHTMERTFEFIRSWWTNETHRATFHPYPWGFTTNIVIKDIIENQ